MTAWFLTIAVVVVLLAPDYVVAARHPHVFVVIMNRFAVPAELQQRALPFGIAAALVMRAAHIVFAATAFALLGLGILAITTVASLIRVRAHPEEIAHAGTVSKPTQHAESDEARR